VATAAWMVSFGLKVVIGAVTRMSAPTALPRSTAVTEAVAGIGAGGSAIGAGSLATGGGAGSSFFLQPTSATLPSRTASTLMCRRLRLFISDFLVVRRGGCTQSSRAGIFSTWPGWMRSGSESWSRLASKMRFQSCLP